MAVSEPGQEKSGAVYQAFCEMWLSLLFPRQETEWTAVFEQGCVHFSNSCKVAATHRKQGSEITQ